MAVPLGVAVALPLELLRARLEGGTATGSVLLMLDVFLWRAMAALAGPVDSSPSSPDASREEGWGSGGGCWCGCGCGAGRSDALRLRLLKGEEDVIVDGVERKKVMTRGIEENSVVEIGVIPWMGRAETERVSAVARFRGPRNFLACGDEESWFGLTWRVH